jgi:hypothetical protein
VGVPLSPIGMDKNEVAGLDVGIAATLRPVSVET